MKKVVAEIDSMFEVATGTATSMRHGFPLEERSSYAK